MSDPFTETERREMAGRARTLHERVAGPPNEPGGDHPDPDRLLDAWRDRFPDEETFAGRLDHLGLTEGELRERVRATRWPADEPLPAWVADLESLVDHVLATGVEGGRREEVPAGTAFEELLGAVADYALASLPEGALPAGTLAPMTGWLVERLERLTVRALYVEFRSYLEPRAPELAAADPDAFEDPPTEHYDRFVAAMFEVGLPNLCLEYPVLARRLVGTVEGWTGTVTELSRRIREDRPELVDRFGVDGAVTALEPLVDDAHAGGRVPVRVAFESGSVVYKPRDVGGGVLFHSALERLDEHLPAPSVWTPTYLRRDGYGWMETVAYADPADGAAVDRYYERAGVVLCLAYALGLVDCQVENLIVAGEHPVVVDAETVFTPRVDPERRPFPGGETEPITRSVLSTALLPYWSGDQKRQVYAAGFGAGSETATLPDLTRPAIRGANTDVMAVGTRAPSIDRDHNTPTVDGEDHPPGDHVDALERGFEAAHRAIRELHSEGRFFGGIVDRDLAGEIETRLIYRPTVAYDTVRRSLSSRDPLRDGTWATVEMEDLAVAYFDGRVEADGTDSLYAAERRALRRSDVPRLATAPDSRRTVHDGEELGFTTDTTGLDRSRRRVEGLDAADLARQSWITRESVTPPRDADPPPAAAVPDDDRLRQAAVDLFDGIVAGVDPREDWTVMVCGEGGLTLKSVDRSVYQGRCGTAIAAAGLYATTGHDRYRAFATDLLGPVVAAFEGGDAPSLGLGGTEGVGAVVYALSVVADLLDEAGYRDLAREAALTVTDDRLAGDDTLDVVGGTAGTLLALLAHHDRFGGREVLDRAVACGDRLLDARESVGGHRVWTTTGEAPLTGFSHGTAGIACALARLADVAGGDRYADAVREALAFEADLYDPDRRNWPVECGDDEYRDRWCHGRAGIALARLEIADRLGESVLPTPPGAVLPATAAAEPSPLDEVCCGNFGRVEALLEGADRGAVDARAARRLAGRCLARRERDGRLAQPGRTLSMVNPALFKGEAGAAYVLERVRDPGAIPCLSRFE